ncbi:MAG: hypothetical protein IIC35_06135, partial [Gemmatimonadetes bacterium]|nr:hypothetical protein [Gemmatimonadota bacterium]
FPNQALALIEHKATSVGPTMLSLGYSYTDNNLVAAIVEYEGACHFRACTHIHEPKCAVRSALQSGDIVESRHASYVTLRLEAEEAAAR